MVEVFVSFGFGDFGFEDILVIDVDVFEIFEFFLYVSSYVSSDGSVKSSGFVYCWLVDVDINEIGLGL